MHICKRTNSCTHPCVQAYVHTSKSLGKHMCTQSHAHTIQMYSFTLHMLMHTFTGTLHTATRGGDINGFYLLAVPRLALRASTDLGLTVPPRPYLTWTKQLWADLLDSFRKTSGLRCTRISAPCVRGDVSTHATHRAPSKILADPLVRSRTLECAQKDPSCPTPTGSCETVTHGVPIASRPRGTQESEWTAKSTNP